MWEVVYTVDGRELAREATGEIPARGDEVYVEQHTGVIAGGLFEVAKVRRVVTETGTQDSTARALAGGPVDVVARSAYVTLKRLKE
jgi:hypothetical protein